MQKYLTFDCYFTLLDESSLYDKVAEIGEKLGVDGKSARERFVTYQEDRSNMHPYLDYDLLTRNNLINLDFKFGLEHKFEKYYVEVMEAHRNLKPYPEVIDTLEKFIALRYKLIMMSNSSWSIIPENVKALEVPFDVWTAEDVHSYKPDLHFFKPVEDHYGFNEQNHIHIAQGYMSDMEPAGAMDWPTVWVNRYHDKATGLYKPTYEVSKLDEILPILK
ncbi:HAD hydrolase-like protein [Companilactobacillus mishanensis]|uniref:HAD family hydrolase n=1 Tax=Companilactobacillus mishanensis TaxID=2486008 RepID=A0ABW9P673_9LACO|nr:HAD hydrolase-like protein [Companilactobacillus mishanensis]MQS44695.1 HAD family hydrolase [Companilactobacillus mishanensis]